MARPKDKEEIILAAALEAFMNRGFSSTSLKDIAQTAGIAKGTIYDYFTSKDDLFIEAVNYQMKLFNDLFLERIRYQGDFLDTIDSFMDLIVSSEIKPRIQWVDVVFMAMPALKPESKTRLLGILNNFRREGIEIWKRILTIGVEEGKVSAMDLDFAATCAFCLTSAYNNHLSELTEIQYDKEKERLTMFILKGIGFKDVNG